jgi:hypothetical protein
MAYGIQIYRHISSRIRILILLDFSRGKGPKLSPEQRDWWIMQPVWTIRKRGIH